MPGRTLHRMKIQTNANQLHITDSKYTLTDHVPIWGYTLIFPVGSSEKPQPTTFTLPYCEVSPQLSENIYVCSATSRIKQRSVALLTVPIRRKLLKDYLICQASGHALDHLSYPASPFTTSIKSTRLSIIRADRGVWFSFIQIQKECEKWPWMSDRK